jgi:hypothetical protein
MAGSAVRVDAEVMIPDLLRAAPQARAVLDSYGLRGCGGPLGPVESLGSFARAHEVHLPALLEELRAAAQAPRAAHGAPPRPALGDAIYRPFFKSGIAVVLSLGAVWGAYLLLRIAWAGRFGAAGLHEVNAHGHAQIFGWVGLFVMGFAYQAFPRFKHASLSHPRLALASLVLMLAGLVARSVCEPLAETLPLAGPVAVAGAGLEVLAVALFAWVVCATWRSAGKPLAVYDYYILSSLAWFVLQAVGEAAYLSATLAASGREELLALVATWQAPLRDLQIHGFALLMILGVSQRLFHHVYGLPAASPRLSLAALACLNAAVAGEAVGLVLMRAGGHAWAALWYASVLLLAGTVVLLVRDWRLFSPAGAADRSLKFLRAAYVWLLLSLAMLVLLPAYQRGLLPALAPESESARIGFSHAYYGAVRHAITVGFISLMIVGVAARIVPTLNGLDVRRLPGLWLPFLLINAGCALRVLAQTATDFSSSSFPLAGLSGLLEVAGLAVWGAHLWRIMAGRSSGAQTQESPPAGTPEAAFGPDDRVGAVLGRHPELLDAFLAFGFRPLTNPLLRRTLAAHVSLREACSFLGVDLGQLLAALNAACAGQAGTRRGPAGHACGCCSTATSKRG